MKRAAPPPEANSAGRNCCRSLTVFACVIAHLTELGYDGYIASEYEGQRFVPVGEFVDDTDQVRRHQQYLKSLIDAQEA